MQGVPLLPANLAAIAQGRDFLETREFSRAINRSDQTVRKWYAREGACFGVRPLKVGGRLIWPVAQIAALLNGQNPSQAA